MPNGIGLAYHLFNFLVGLYITILPIPHASVTKVTSISYKFAAKSLKVIDASKDRLAH